MAGIGLQGAYGAKAGADALTEILTRKFEEAMKIRQMEAQEEQARQAQADRVASRGLQERQLQQSGDYQRGQLEHQRNADASLAEDRVRTDALERINRAPAGLRIKRSDAGDYKKYSPELLKPATRMPQHEPGWVGPDMPEDDPDAFEFVGTQAAATAKERMESQQAIADARMASQQAIADARNDVSQARAGETAARGETARGDRSYQFHSSVMDKMRKPFDDAASRLQRLKETLMQGTPQADALVAPELLTVMAGGQGSGLRMNEAEIARIIGGRSQWENLRAAAQHWSVNPETANSITPEQRRQIRSLVSAVDTRMNKALSTLDAAGQDLLNAARPEDHRRIVNQAKTALTSLNSGSGQSTTTTQETPEQRIARLLGKQ